MCVNGRSRVILQNLRRVRPTSPRRSSDQDTAAQCPHPSAVTLVLCLTAPAGPAIKIFVMMGERRSGKGQIRGCPLSSELLLVLLLLLARAGSSGSCDLRNLDVVAVPWTVAFGNCSFAGNSKGAPLVRTGSCLTQAGALSLQSKCITALPTDAFQGMPLMTSVP